MEPRITKRASFGVKKTGYDALYKPNLSQWQKESMGELIPLEPVPEYHIGWREFVALAVMIVGIVVWAVSK